MEYDVRGSQVSLWRKIFPHGHYPVARSWLENETHLSRFLNMNVRNIIFYIIANLTIVVSMVSAVILGCCFLCCRRSVKPKKNLKNE